ncbi:hypothetical protein ACFL2Q_13370 [Thermodesulfobacteriota bacterium]
MAMCYNHADRIGNEGDVAKHAVLAAFVATLIEQPQALPFIYVESHTGRALYQGLPRNGRWENGIGPFSDRLLAEEALEDTSYPNLRVYGNACFHTKILAGSDYHGSSGLVFRMLRKAGIPFRFHLWDNDTTVCHSLMSFFENWPEVSICRGDGYEGVCMIRNPTLALIDPISIKGQDERSRILSILNHLGANEIPFICWTAIVEGEETAVEAFSAAVETDFSTHRVTWQPAPGTTTKGCQITVPKGSWESLAGNTLGELRQLMEWIK